MEHAVLNGMSPSTLPPPGSGTCVEEKRESLLEPEAMADSVETAAWGHKRIAAHTNSQRLWQQAKDSHGFKSDREGEVDKSPLHQLPASTRNTSFLQWSLTDILISFWSRPHAQEPAQKMSMILS